MNKNSIGTRTSKSRPIAAALAGLLVAWAAPPVESSEACYRARVSERGELPDGSVHPPGQIRICLERRLSPVERLYTITVDGGAPTPFLARADEIERTVAPGEPPLFVFRRTGAATLRFEGLVVAHDRTARLYRPWVPGRWPAIVRSAGSAPTAMSEAITLVATPDVGFSSHAVRFAE